MELKLSDVRDTDIPHAVAKRVAQKVGGLIVPSIYYGL